MISTRCKFFFEFFFSTGPTFLIKLKGIFPSVGLFENTEMDVTIKYSTKYFKLCSYPQGYELVVGSININISDGGLVCDGQITSFYCPGLAGALPTSS